MIKISLINTGACATRKAKVEINLMTIISVNLDPRAGAEYLKYYTKLKYIKLN
jgi:hypothetical protein